MLDSLITPELNNETLHLIAYTDGGCNPNPGPGGWGLWCKAYIVPQSIKYVPPSSKATIGVFNPVDVEGLKQYNFVELHARQGTARTTNNIMEMTAIIEALELVISTPSVSSIMIYSDSQTALKGLKDYMPKWKANGWVKQDGQPPKNIDEWKKLDSLILKLIDLGITFKTQWVKGHSGDVGNEKADVLATKAQRDIAEDITTITVEVNTSSSKVFGHVNVPKCKKPKPNRMISYPKWYFVTKIPTPVDVLGRHVYYTSTHGKDKELDAIGKDVADAGFSVAYITNPVEAMEEMRNHQNSVLINDYNMFVIAKLDVFLSGQGATEFFTDKFKYLEPITRFSKDLSTITGRSYTTIMDPPRRALNAFNGFDQLRMKLDIYLSSPNTMQRTDVTSSLYDISVNGKGKTTCKLTTDIVSATKCMKLPVNMPSGTGTIDVSLTIGQDLPDRNTLSALASRSPKVFTVSWAEGDFGMRYASVIECGDDVGIWSSIYANLQTY